MTGFDLLGIDDILGADDLTIIGLDAEPQTAIVRAAPIEPEPIHKPISWPATVAAIGGGVLVASLWPGHPVLKFLGTSALINNAHAVATKRRTWKVAAERVCQHVVATAGSLAVPSHPALAYVAAAIAADMLIDGDGNGLLEEWAHRSGVEVVDVTPIRPDHETKALALT